MSDLNTSGLYKKNGEPKKKRSAKFYALIIAGALVLVLITFLLIIIFNSSNEQSKYSIGYVVYALPEEGALKVDINIDISKLSRDRTILLYKGMMTELTMQVRECVDDSGNEIPYIESPDLIAIGPIEDGSTQVCFKYVASIGTINDEAGYYGLPLYAQGCLYEDLIAFSGEYTLLIPFLDPENFDSMDKYIKGVSFEFVVPEGLQSIIPYQAPLDGQLSFSVEKPDWEFFNCISKSAFCFGQFESYDYDGAFGDIAVYIDKAIINELSHSSLDAMTGFLYYYTSLFGEPLDDMPIVLLRSFPDEDILITAGVGSGGAAMSANLRIADDFRVMSNMLFHAFFDSKIKPYNLRYAGYEWIYKGMAEHYVGNSIDYLPGTVKETYSIGDSTPMREKYLRYLYFSLKEPGFLAVGPAAEAMGMYIPQEEFYINVKASVIIDVINFSIGEKTGQEDSFIKELVKRGGSPKPLDVEKLLKELCGGDSDVITDYLSGKALVPNFRGFNVDDMAKENILFILNEAERRYSYIFGRHNVSYPYYPLFLLHEEPFMAEVEARGISYNSEEIQNMVKQFSNVLHIVLLERAMWASFAGIDDITFPNISRELAQNDVKSKWSEFCQGIGFEYETEDYTDIYG